MKQRPVLLHCSSHRLPAGLSCSRLLLQQCFYLWPLGIDDAEPNGVALAAVGHDALVPDDSFLLRANAQDRRSRLFV